MIFQNLTAGTVFQSAAPFLEAAERADLRRQGLSPELLAFSELVNNSNNFFASCPRDAKGHCGPASGGGTPKASFAERKGRFEAARAGAKAAKVKVDAVMSSLYDSHKKVLYGAEGSPFSRVWDRAETHIINHWTNPTPKRLDRMEALVKKAQELNGRPSAGLSARHAAENAAHLTSILKRIGEARVGIAEHKAHRDAAAELKAGQNLSWAAKVRRNFS